ncbi:MAG TPA: DUF885 domain-containing protein, partial [Pseudonocardiaceae bacterium]|nr:DUF885 domain-containing protein [Pseudonocardiaceae bacterium]
MSEAGSARALADDLVAVLKDQEPAMATLLGIDGDHSRLADLSEAAEQEYRARFVELAERATALDPAELDPAEKLTRSVVIQQARTRIDSLDSKLVEHTVTDLFVAPAAVLLTALPMIGLPTAELAEAYVQRLSGIPAHLDGAAQRHRAGIAAGRVPVAHLVEAAIKHIDRYLADPDNDPLTRPVPPADVAEDINGRRDAVLADVVRPAFAAYRDVLINEVLPHGRPADRPGLSWLPGGDADYARLVRVHTTTDRTPDELHETGLAIVDQLRAEYAELGRRVLGTDDLGEIFHLLRHDDKLRWDSEDELLDAAREAIARAEAAAPAWFGLLPRQTCEVRPVPASDAAGSPAAYYMPASMDGSRPGVYYANTDQVTERFRHQAEATAFHEAVPGHHFQ